MHGEGAFEKCGKACTKAVAAWAELSGQVSMMFSIYLMTLFRLSGGQQEIGCSFIVAGRQHDSLQDVVGVFVNSLLIKAELDEEEPFNLFIKRINDQDNNRHIQENKNTDCSLSISGNHHGCRCR